MTTPGEKIKFLRQLNGWDQSDLAERAGVRQSSISHIERGNRTGKIESLQAIADAFDVSIGMLIDPSIPLEWFEKASHLLAEMQDLTEEQQDAVLQMISALKSSRER
jgi:transcriptional regulator with XRE-family HTH domain